MDSASEQISRKFCDQLRVLELECKLNDVVIAVPVSWRQNNNLKNLDGIHIEFATSNHLVFRASYLGKIFEYQQAIES